MTIAELQTINHILHPSPFPPGPEEREAHPDAGCDAPPLTPSSPHTYAKSSRTWDGTPSYAIGSWMTGHPQVVRMGNHTSSSLSTGITAGEELQLPDYQWGHNQESEQLQIPRGPPHRRPLLDNTHTNSLVTRACQCL